MNHRQFEALDRKLDRILRRQHDAVYAAIRMEIRMSVAMDNITREVAETKTVVDSAIVLINGIADRIREAGVDAVKLEALSAELDSKSAELAAAVAANTPPVVATAR